MQKTKTLQKNKILVIPPILENLYAIKEGLSGTDRDDHLTEVLEQEKKVKEAIIKLSMLGHEGIQLLVAQAKSELTDVNLKLMKPPMMEDSIIANTASYAFRQQCLFNQRDLWLWFLNFFTSAEDAQKEVEKFVAEQEQPKLEEEY